ncbi:Uncharacterised protein [Mycobacterium tuberculosis]|uniref:Uncharacterized protein n=1 Tax=Mycobacterium tuberculosis TaxID=1773 RepID=A0A655ALQ5_MYCTX|nr:Uncharacterised protein [Mycobacterium tuberculosis]
MPPTLTAKLRWRYSSVTDAPPISSMIAAVWKIVSMPSTAAAQASASVMSPCSTSSCGCAGNSDGARSKERTQCPRSSKVVTRLAPTKPAPPVTRTRPSSVVSDASPMRRSITLP